MLKLRPHLSLHTRLFLWLVLLFMPLLTLAAIYFAHLEQVINHQAQQRLNDNSRLLAQTFVSPHLSELMHQFNTLYDAALPAMQRADTLALNRSADWRLLGRLRDDIQLIYFGAPDNRTASFPLQPYDPDYLPPRRPWYQAALQSPGEARWSEPYIDHTTGQPVITLSRAVLNQQGEVSGVFAMDTLLSTLSQGMKSSDAAQGGWLGLLNQSGHFIAHSDQSQLWQPLAASHWQHQVTAAAAGSFIDQQSQLYVSWRRLPGQDWVLLSVLPLHALTLNLDNATRNAIWIIAAAVLLYLMIASLISRKLRSEISRVLRYLRRVWQSPDQQPGDFSYPEFRQLYNEIFVVSQDYHAANRRANRDSLTGAFNRSYLDPHLDGLINSKQAFCVGLFDLDNFKLLNDSYGHLVGDTVLSRITQLCQQLLGKQGVLIRYGGEEFVVIINGSLHQATASFEQLRQAVHSLQWREPDLMTSFSGGLVPWQGQSRKQLLREADKLVYQAKREGKNRICTPLTRQETLDEVRAVLRPD